MNKFQQGEPSFSTEEIRTQITNILTILRTSRTRIAKQMSQIHELEITTQTIRLDKCYNTIDKQQHKPRKTVSTTPITTHTEIEQKQRFRTKSMHVNIQHIKNDSAKCCKDMARLKSTNNNENGHAENYESRQRVANK